MPVPHNIDHETAEPQTLNEIRDWHRGIIAALIDQRVSVQQAIRVGSSVAPRFVGMTESDIDAHYVAQRRELDRLTVLNLVASAEATIKVDYFRRVREKRKDTLAVAYRKWHKTLSRKKQRRPDFDDDGILDIIKQTGVIDKNIVGRFRECLQVRHWVGHGRFWAKPMNADRLDPDDVLERADELLRA